MPLKFVTGDVVRDCGETYLAHQCNCVSTGSKGVASAIFAAFPYANVYRDRDDASVPGTVVVSGDVERGERLVANMMAQRYPGRHHSSDSAANRQRWFGTCLEEIARHARTHPGLRRSIGVPWMIGCGLAGGDWVVYAKMLYNFSKQHAFEVVVYRLPPDQIAASGEIVVAGGSRQWRNERVINQALRELPCGSVIVHAGTPGADVMVGAEVRKMAHEKRFQVIRMPLAWSRSGRGFHKSVNAIKLWKPSAVMIFHHDAGASRGCKSMIAMAEKACADVRVYNDSGIVK